MRFAFTATLCLILSTVCGADNQQWKQGQMQDERT